MSYVDGLSPTSVYALPIQFLRVVSYVYTISHSALLTANEYVCRADILCLEVIIDELEALDKLTIREETQIINYLKASGKSSGLLHDFGNSSLEQKRPALNLWK